MSAELNTEPVMLVLRQTDYDSGAIIPIAVGAEGIPNDHRGYAITWFSLAFIWLVMTGYLLYRIRKTDKGEAI
jgi:surfeit locus 1 family protein